MLFNIDVLDYSQMGRQGRRVPHGLFFPISFCGSNNAKLIVNNSSGTARVTRTKLPAMLKVAFAAGPAVLVWKMLALWVNLMTGNCSEASVELISTLGVCLWSLLLGWLFGCVESRTEFIFNLSSFPGMLYDSALLNRVESSLIVTD